MFPFGLPRPGVVPAPGFSLAAIGTAAQGVVERPALNDRTPHHVLVCLAKSEKGRRRASIFARYFFGLAVGA
jgi:hypothetical protein